MIIDIDISAFNCGDCKHGIVHHLVDFPNEECLCDVCLAYCRYRNLTEEWDYKVWLRLKELGLAKEGSVI